MTLEERIPIKVLFDRKDAAEWQRLNPVIDDGELVVELDTHRLKVGDGKLNYNDLPYYEGPRGESITKAQLSENGDLSVWIGEKETKLGNIKGQKGDKGTSITDITKDGETLTIKLSDDSQKTFNIPNGQKGDRGKSVESARVDESGNFYVTIEGQSEKLLGNIKGGKGDKGDSLKFEDLTPEQIAQIKAKDVDLSSYATKAELKEIDVSKQLTDYLQKTEADKTYLKKSDKVELPRDLVKTGDIADVVRKSDLTAYATKDELKKISVGQAIPVFTTSYKYDKSYLKSYSSDSYRGTWSVNEDASKLLAGDIVALEITNTSERAKNYLIVSVVSSSRSSITSISRELSKDKPEGTTFLTQKDADKIYATKQHKHEIDDINGLRDALSHKANDHDYLEQSTADSLYLAKHEIEGYLSSYVRSADIRSQLNNIGKLKDTKTGQFLDVMIVDNGQVPHDTSGMIVFERA
ncbi:hypothetical protein [Streptococcus dysgalactiae]|uniref:Hyaluronoglucosaminidase n=1 Tax=Streptococcus dysgalactiae subsp. equisimilis TaxID=119602 RepID=A0A9X8T1A8_STREQ|nr:hypothetical protein [Streptococcus dysgalactiae]SQF67892.1 hyaluronoglucosaminidase [Streptococcus dysgalactiae subsp. equisimilis]VEF05151.1 hyaluronoglucosaminidase [Streptococcus dysgalactiae subsp. equisimilis]